jgi:hypothetical protein
MVLLPMHSSIADVAPKAMAIMISGLRTNRKLWEGLANCGMPHAVIGSDCRSPKLHVFGGQAIDSIFDEYVPIALELISQLPCEYS